MVRIILSFWCQWPLSVQSNDQSIWQCDTLISKGWNGPISWTQGGCIHSDMQSCCNGRCSEAEGGAWHLMSCGGASHSGPPGFGVTDVELSACSVQSFVSHCQLSIFWLKLLCCSRLCKSSMLVVAKFCVHWSEWMHWLLGGKVQRNLRPKALVSLKFLAQDLKHSTDEYSDFRFSRWSSTGFCIQHEISHHH